MSTSLDASTLTPGRTAPDVSFTTPAIAVCAGLAPGAIASHSNARPIERAASTRRIRTLLQAERAGPRSAEAASRGDDYAVPLRKQRKWDKTSQCGTK